MKITDEMIETFERAGGAAALAGGEGIRAGLEAVVAPIVELEKHPRCMDNDKDGWHQDFPGVWVLHGDFSDDGQFLSTAHLLEQYGPCEGFGVW